MDEVEHRRRCGRRLTRKEARTKTGASVATKAVVFI